MNGTKLFAVVIGSMIAGTSAYAATPGTTTRDLRFDRACERSDQQLLISAVGDILPQTPMSLQAYANPQEGFGTLFTNIKKWVSFANISYANLEGPTAARIAKGGKIQDHDQPPGLDNRIYTATDMNFNYHPRIITDLKRTGFNLLSMANNHSFDRTRFGVDMTVDAMENAGMPYVGAKNSKRMDVPWVRRVTENGINTAWIACTYSLNGPETKDPLNQVLNCFIDQELIISQIQKLAAIDNVHAIFIAPHWGVEYQDSANSSQTKLARRFLEAGATAIIGSHPHVLQQVEKYITADGRETLIIYSLGNFIANQSPMKKRMGAIAFIGLSRNINGKAWINGFSYLPTWRDIRPQVVTPLVESKQATVSAALKHIHTLFDSSRELSPDSEIKANFECH